jgi:hypothetical protein
MTTPISPRPPCGRGRRIAPGEGPFNPASSPASLRSTTSPARGRGDIRPGGQP